MKMNSHFRSPGETAPLTREQIAALAHEIWLERGSPEGSDVDIWLEAERQLRAGASGSRERDPIPADPERADPDSDPALHPRTDREIEDIGRPPSDDPSATAYGV